jgi:plastocyanin
MVKQTGSLGMLFTLVVGWASSIAYSYDEVVVPNGGSIRGTVTLEGKATELPPLQVTKFKTICKDVPDESLLVGPGQGLRYAVVALEKITQGRAIKKGSVPELDNAKCRFTPHVQTASVGQFVLLKNSDPILHTAHARFSSGQPDFNVGLYPSRSVRKPLMSPGVVKILCEVHPWMTAYIVVAEHPYQSVTDMYGEYLIDAIPPGNYKIKVWHEKLGVQEKSVEIRAGAAQKLDFLFAPTRRVKN